MLGSEKEVHIFTVEDFSGFDVLHSITASRSNLYVFKTLATVSILHLQAGSQFAMCLLPISSNIIACQHPKRGTVPISAHWCVFPTLNTL